MKRSFVNLIATVLLLGISWLVPHSVFSVKLETPGSAESASVPHTPSVDTSTVPPAPTAETPTGQLPAVTEAAGPQRDPLGELYFTVSGFEQPTHLARLPGSCVVGKIECPTAETVFTPFDVAEMVGGLIWSPDGKTALALTHAPDDLNKGMTKEELEQLEKTSREDYRVLPSVLYLFDAETGEWSELYRLENKFITSPFWSRDGQWIAFQVRNSPWVMHPILGDDGIYVIHSDGTGAQQLNNKEAVILGWIGSSILYQSFENTRAFPNPYQVEMLGLDGLVKMLFASERAAYYHLSPEGSIFVVADAHVENQATPLKAVDLLALDGNSIHSFGVYGNTYSSIWPVVWSPDGLQVAYCNLAKVYLAMRDGEPRQIFEAENPYGEPRVWNILFSPDSKYLLIEAYDGMPYATSISLEDGQENRLAWAGMDSDDQTHNLTWRP
jgi:hypothetical protein